MQIGRLVETLGIFKWVWATFLFGRKTSFRPKFQSHLITSYVCLIAYRKQLVVEGIVI